MWLCVSGFFVYSGFNSFGGFWLMVILKGFILVVRKLRYSFFVFYLTLFEGCFWGFLFLVFFVFVKNKFLGAEFWVLVSGCFLFVWGCREFDGYRWGIVRVCYDG